MFRKYISFILVILILNLVCGAGAFGQKTAQDKASEKAAKKAEKLKVQVAKLGTGKNAKIEVQLTNGSTIKGQISKIGDDSFTIISEQSGAATEIQYTDAKKISRHHVPLALKIGLGIAIGFAAILGISYVLCRTTACD